MKVKKFIFILVLVLISINLISCTKKQVTISFDTKGGNELESIVIDKNNTISLPTPEKEGNVFLGWFDGDILYNEESIFSEDITLQASWKINEYDVIFIDYDDQTLKQEKVEYGSTPTSPTVPVREGYTFNGWDKDFSSVKENLIIKAIYEINTYTVRFIDYDDSLIDEQVIEYGKDAVSPSNPFRDGYSFIGWDKEFSSIKSDMTINALYDQHTNGFIYEKVGAEYVVVGYEGNETDLVIPNTYNGLPVTKIGDFAFTDNWKLTSMVLPESIVEIGEQAFARNDSLTRINLPSGLKVIGKEAFTACTRLTKIEIYAENIGEAAFDGCSSITDITIHNTVKTIGSYAFYNNSNLESIYIPSTVTSMGNHVFSWSRKLQTIYTESDNVTNLQTMLDEGGYIYTNFVVQAKQ